MLEGLLHFRGLGFFLWKVIESVGFQTLSDYCKPLMNNAPASESLNVGPAIVVACTLFFLVFMQS